MHDNLNTIEGIYKDPSWYEAFTLNERVSALQCCNKTTHTIKSEKFELWESLLSDPEDFERLLSAHAITSSDLNTICATPAKDLFSGTPLWLKDLVNAYTSFKPDGSFPRCIDELCQGLLLFIKPVVAKAWNELQADLRHFLEVSRMDLPGALLSLDSVTDILISSLPSQYRSLISRTLVLQLNIERKQNNLQGDTPEARFSHFLSMLGDSGYVFNVLREYPVLARRIIEVKDNWKAVALKFFVRLCSDWDEVLNTFFKDRPSTLGVLEGIEGDVGDKHAQGNSVFILRFTSGAKLLYKPRSLAADYHFQSLISWTNTRGFSPRLKAASVLDRGTYGWAEHINHESCNSTEGIKTFYMRQGGLLALMYILNAVDFHAENVIASGDHPILIDIEALFHQKRSSKDTMKTDSQDFYGDTVLKTGYLPRMFFSDSDSEGVDLSGMGKASNQVTPFKVPVWTNIGTDLMRVAFEHVPINEATNQPVTEGQQVAPDEYVEYIAQGFRSMYLLLERERTSLLNEVGPIMAFREDRVRYIARNTRFYADRLLDTYHPDLLKNGLDKDIFLSNIFRTPVFGNTGGDTLSLSEINDLTSGDIPIFYTQVGSRHIWDSNGLTTVDFFVSSGLDLVQQRIRSLCADDLARQLWFVRTSFATKSMGTQRRHRKDEVSVIAQDVRNQDFISVATHIAKRLDQLSLTHDRAHSWMGVTSQSGENWHISPVGLDLYSGLSGIALFFAYFEKVTGNKSYTTLTSDICSNIIRKTAETESMVQGKGAIGAFGSLGGAIYALSHLGSVLQKPELHQKAVELAQLLPPLIKSDCVFDVIGGSAGSLLSLLSLFKVKPSQGVLDIAVTCGEHLVEHLVKTDFGYGWPPSADHATAVLPLTGFSHGASGIGLALTRLYEVTSESHFKETALRGVEYERAFYNEIERNWFDLRDGPNSVRTSVSWCHGAPGIGMSRLSMQNHLEEAAAVDISNALLTTVEKGFGDNHCLCHGDMGNLDLFIHAEELYSNSSHIPKMSHIAGALKRTITNGGIVCGVPLGTETPDFMVGISGIGYQFLRTSAPKEVPSVLTLEAPA